MEDGLFIRGQKTTAVLQHLIPVGANAQKATKGLYELSSLPFRGTVVLETHCEAQSETVEMVARRYQRESLFDDD